MSKSEQLDKFNRTFTEFVNDLITVFPNDSDFRMVKMAVLGLQLTAPSLLHDNFRERVVIPFSEKILAKDEGFFLHADYAEQTCDVGDAVNIITKVKQMYQQMKDDDRAVVWRYMRVLVLLSNKLSSS